MKTLKTEAKSKWTYDYIYTDLMETQEDNELWDEFTTWFRNEKGHNDWTDDEINTSLNEDDIEDFYEYLHLNESKKLTEVKDVKEFCTYFNRKEFYNYLEDHLSDNLAVDALYDVDSYANGSIYVYDKGMKNDYDDNDRIASIDYDKDKGFINVVFYTQAKIKKYTDVDELINDLNNYKSEVSESKKLKTEAIYLVTPDNDNEQVNIDELNRAVQEITNTVKQNDATDVALDIADEELIPEGSENGDTTDEAVIVGEIPVEETEELIIADPEVEVQDATQTIMNAAEEVNDNPTSDVEAELIPNGVEVGQQLVNGPMYDLAKYLITAYHTTASLHRNLKGGAWFADHVQLDEYASEFLKMVDDVIEQNIALGGIEPDPREALNDYVVCDIRERDKNESYRIVREMLQTIINLIDSAKENGIPADITSKLEEYQNWCRKEADYKIARTILGESKLMTRAEMKAEKLLEAKLSQAKQDALKDAIETGDDMYVYQDGDEVYYTDESPKRNPSLFKRVKLLGTFITDMKDGKMTATYKAERFDRQEYVSTSKFRKRINENKIGETEIPDTMDYVGEENNPKLEEIPTDKITLDQFKKDHKEEIDNSYKMTYGEEVDKDLYNALADYMYTDSITGNVQTKKDYIDPVDEVEENKDLVNDNKNK